MSDIKEIVKVRGMQQADTERRLSTKENMLWNSVGNFIYLFSQWLLTYVVVRVLGYESAGFFSLAMTIGTSFSCIALYTMRNFQTSDVAGEYCPATYIRSRHTTCALSLATCAVFALVNSYDGYTLACVLAYMAFKTSEALADVYYGIMQRKSRMDYIGVSFAIKGIAEFVLFLGALLLIGDLFVGILLLVGSSYLITIVYDRQMALRGVEPGKTTWDAVRGLLVACLPVAAYGFLFNTAAQLPRYFIELVMGAEQLGYYTSIAMPVVIVQVFANFIFAPLVTPMAEMLRDDDTPGFRRVLWRTLGSISVITVAALVGFGLLGEWFLVLLFGDSIVPYAYLVEPLVVCTALTAFAWFLSAVVTILRELKVLLALSAAMFVIVAALSVSFIEWFGLNGASFILALALVVFVVGCAAIIHARLAR